MNLRKHFLEALTLVVAALFCAVVANAVASRERRVAVVGNYPNALKVPGETVDPTPITTASSTRLDTAANEVPRTNTTPATETTATVAPAATGAPTASILVKSATPKGPLATPAPAPHASGVPPAAAQESALARFAPHEKQAYVELHGDDVAWLYQRGVLFLDARRTSDYEKGHIAGARSFPVWESDIDDRVNQLYRERGSDPAVANQPIVAYCSGGECEDSHMLAQKLWGVTFNNVYVYKDGFPDWQKRGGSVLTGAKP